MAGGGEWLSPRLLGRALGGLVPEGWAVTGVDADTPEDETFRATAVLTGPGGGARRVGVFVKRYLEDKGPFTRLELLRRERRAALALGGRRAGVPLYYGASEEHLAAFMEDLGDRTLARELSAAGPAGRGAIIGRAMRALARIHAEGTSALRGEGPPARWPTELYCSKLIDGLVNLARFLRRPPPGRAELDDALGYFRLAVDSLMSLPDGCFTLGGRGCNPRHVMVAGDGLKVVDLEYSGFGVPASFDVGFFLARTMGLGADEEGAAAGLYLDAAAGLGLAVNGDAFFDGLDLGGVFFFDGLRCPENVAHPSVPGRAVEKAARLSRRPGFEGLEPLVRGLLNA